MDKAVINLGHGAITVENPPDDLLLQLRRFRHSGDLKGGYEDLFFRSGNGKGNIISTSPGFADRILGFMRDRRYPAKLFDKRVPMPTPNMEDAKSGIDPVWHKSIEDAIKAGGGIIGISEMLGSAAVAASILKAYPHEALLERGTSISIVATKDRESQGRMAATLRRLLPGRDVGKSSPGSSTDSDDIIVTTYGGLKDLPCWPAGILIGDDLPNADFIERAEAISAFRNAARWGLYTTAAGGCPGTNLYLEGLFGKVVAEAKYKDAVDAGIAVPITVCWLPAPPPKLLGYGDFRILEANAIQNNQEFLQLCADIIKNVPSEVGCMLCTEHSVTAERIAALVPEVAQLHRKMQQKQRKIILSDMASNNIRRAIATFDFAPTCGEGRSLSVLVTASCRGAEVAGLQIPWRGSMGPSDRTYIVDFTHKWDVHNTYPGKLAINDESRMVRYRELGFRQISVDSVSQLPFM